MAAGTAAVPSIGFALPDGAVLADLPGGTATWQVRADGLTGTETDDPVPVLHELTGWALRRGLPVRQLTVERPSLEDVYLRLTGGDRQAAPPNAGTKARRRRSR